MGIDLGRDTDSTFSVVLDDLELIAGNEEEDDLTKCNRSCTSQG